MTDAGDLYGDDVPMPEDADDTLDELAPPPEGAWGLCPHCDGGWLYEIAPGRYQCDGCGATVREI